MPQRFQLAIQGGGAKLCALIAALEAFEKYENDNKIEITRISGTSAGAIAGAIYAAKIPMDSARKHLKNCANKYIERLKVNRNSQPSQSKLLNKWSKIKQSPSTLNNIRRAFFGLPICDEQVLLDFLEDMFKALGSRNADEIVKIKVPLTIAATDIIQGKLKNYQFAPQTTEIRNYTFHDLIQSIADSCALPFIFRSANSPGNSGIADGGICENLPSEVLMHDTDEYGDVIGISFEREKLKIPDTAASYALALLNTAISNSEQRARRALQGFVLPIKTDIGTFDFVEAVDRGLDHDHYERIKLQTEKWLDINLNLIAESPSIISFDQSARAKKAMRDMYKVYMAHHHAKPMEIFRSAMVVYARSFDSNYPDQYDIVRQHIWIKATDEPIYCFPVGYQAAEESLETEDILVSAVNQDTNTIVEIIPIPAEEIIEQTHSGPNSENSTGSTEIKTSKDILTYFKNPIQPGDSVKLTYQDRVKVALDKLEEDKRDFLGIRSRRNVPIEDVNLIVYYPEGAYQHINMEQEEGVSGELMDLGEIYSTYGNPEPGYSCLGMKSCKALEPGNRFRVIVTI